MQLQILPDLQLLDIIFFDPFGGDEINFAAFLVRFSIHSCFNDLNNTHIHGISIAYHLSLYSRNLVDFLSYFRTNIHHHMEKIKPHSRNLVKKTTKFRLKEPVLTTDTASNCCVFWVFLYKSEAIFRISFHSEILKFFAAFCHFIYPNLAATAATRS